MKNCVFVFVLVLGFILGRGESFGVPLQYSSPTTEEAEGFYNQFGGRGISYISSSPQPFKMSERGERKRHFPRQVEKPFQRKGPPSFQRNEEENSYRQDFSQEDDFPSFVDLGESSSPEDSKKGRIWAANVIFGIGTFLWGVQWASFGFLRSCDKLDIGLKNNILLLSMSKYGFWLGGKLLGGKKTFLKLAGWGQIPVSILSDMCLFFC